MGMCKTFGLRTCGFEKAAYIATNFLKKDFPYETEDKEPISFSLQNGSWSFSSSVPELENALCEFEAAVNLCRFTASVLPFPVGLYRFFRRHAGSIEKSLCLL